MCLPGPPPRRHAKRTHSQRDSWNPPARVATKRPKTDTDGHARRVAVPSATRKRQRSPNVYDFDPSRRRDSGYSSASRESRRRTSPHPQPDALRGHGKKRTAPSRSTRSSWPAAQPKSTKQREKRTSWFSSVVSTSSDERRQSRSKPHPLRSNPPDQFSQRPNSYARKLAAATAAHSRTRAEASREMRQEEPVGSFAVRAATNRALEDIRREAFRPPPPRIRRVYGRDVATATMPFHWDCVAPPRSAHYSVRYPPFAPPSAWM